MEPFPGPSAGDGKPAPDQASALVKEPDEVEAVDLLATAGMPLVQRLAPLAAGPIALAALFYYLVG